MGWGAHTAAVTARLRLLPLSSRPAREGGGTCTQQGEWDGRVSGVGILGDAALEQKRSAQHTALQAQQPGCGQQQHQGCKPHHVLKAPKAAAAAAWLQNAQAHKAAAAGGSSRAAAVAGRLTTASEPEASESGDSGVSQPRGGKSDSGLSRRAGSKPAAASAAQEVGLEGGRVGRRGAVRRCKRQARFTSGMQRAGVGWKHQLPTCQPLYGVLRAAAPSCHATPTARPPHLLRPDSSSRLMLSAAFS